MSLGGEDQHRRLVSSSGEELDEDSGDEEARYGHVSISSFDHRRSSVERSLSSPSGLGNGGGGDNNVEEGVSLLNGRRRPLDRNACSRQTSSSLGFCLGAFAMGNMLGWPSTALPNLEASNSSLPITTAQGAWVGSLICLGALLQGPTTGWLMTKVGRRNAMMWMCIPLMTGWLFIVNADAVWMLYTGRLVVGFAAGSFSVITPIYISEIAAPEIRGALGTMFQIFVVLGIFSMYTIGTYISWKGLAIFCSVVPGIIFFVLYFLKDSPASYMMRNRPDLSRKTLIWLRNTADIEEELYAIQRSVDESRRSAERLKISNILCVQDPTIRKPLMLTVFLMINQQLSGINAVITFTVNIFQSSGSTINPNYATMIIGSILLVATVLSSFIVNHVGRRPTLLFTQVIMTLSLMVFGMFFYLKTYSPAHAEALSWLPITTLVIFIVTFSFGLGPLAWLMLGELVPPKIAGVAGAFASMVNWALAFLVTLSFTYLTAALGDYGTYWLFAAFGILGIFFTAKYVPETRGKTLREIQEAFRRG